ncbi:MAG: diacylglycerol kinase family lipid kinase [Bdellovibrionales bacterium]|nr:diacylglycerol kinase family lipid kinase [Bdellovibrionales bacterium]MBT3526741.1 diacylglycerol kinase family lipid kinase [Bdellovibrionales bacterium]MBT7668008.1 diacylglycerol kinase family lipid kinase [Bdellovibrionales bacterium]
MRTLLLVNPNSGNRKTQKAWNSIHLALEELYPGHEVALTAKPTDATNLTRQALKSGIERIIAVGGDGTVNEVVNGFFENGQPINSEAELGIIPSGTGEDFCKTFKIERSLEGAVDVLKRAKIRKIDVGKLTLTDFSNQSIVRYFDNISSFGMSGAIMQRVNGASWIKRLGSVFTFYWYTLLTLLCWRNTKVHLTVDDHFDQEVLMNTIHIANGEYSGAGMHFAPMAQPDDGYFDLIIMGNFKFHHLITSSSMLYNGTHVDHPLVTILKGKKISVSCDHQEIFIEVDGETPGKLPAIYENIPQAIKLIC